MGAKVHKKNELTKRSAHFLYTFFAFFRGLSSLPQAYPCPESGQGIA